MKIKKSLLLTCLLFLGLVLCKTSMGQYITPIPTTYSTIATGSQTLTGQTTTTTQTWFKWIADTGVVVSKIKVTAQGTAYQTVYAEMYVLINDTLFLSYRDSIHTDSTFNLYAGYVKQNANIFIRIINTNTTCAVCTSTNPVINLIIQNSLINCNPVTACDIVKNGGFEHLSGTQCGLSVVNNVVDCWLDFEGTSDVFTAGCTSGSYYNLGSSTIMSPIVPTNASNPNNHNTALAFISNAMWNEASQSLLRTPLIPANKYRISFWAYNCKGTMNHVPGAPVAVNTATPAFTPPVYFTIASELGISPSASNYFPATQNTLCVVSLTATPNTWAQYTFTINSFPSPTGQPHNGIIMGLDYTKNFQNHYLSGNNSIYVFIDEVSITDLTPLNVSSTTNCGSSTGTLGVSGASTYTWQPGNIVGSSVTNTVGSTYTVMGTYGAGSTCTVGPATGTILAKPSPTMNLTASSTTICAGSSTTLTASGTGLQLQYFWSPGGWALGVKTVSPSVTTTYTVTGKDAVNGCPVTKTITIYVIPAATPTITVAATSTLICGAGSSTLTASGAITYTWYPGAISGASISVTPTTTTVYTVQGSACGFTSSKTVTITVVANPTVTVTASSSTICAGLSTTLTAGGATSYTWNPSNATTNPVTVSPTVTTIYTVTGSNVACSRTQTVSVTVNPAPSLTLSPLTVGICLGQSITVSASGASTYSWNTGVTTASISLSPTVTTNYTVTGTGSNGCKSQAVYNLNIKPLPTISVSASANPICAGNTTTLTMSAGGTFNSWSNGVISNTNVVSPSVTTTYTAYTTNFTTGCSNSAIITVTVNPFTSLTVNPSTICVGQTATLTANGATSYTWNTGANTSSITVSPTVTTNYTVSGSSGACPTASASLTLVVNSSFCCQTPVKTFTTGTISSQTTAVSYGNVLIAVNGTLTINVPNFTFTNTNILMAANSQIIIAPSCTVNLNGAHLFSCDYMWEGIEMSDNSRIITNRTLIPNANPTIDDANIAIYSDASAMTTAASITLNNLQLSKNHIGVKIENYTGATAYPFNMVAVTIQGDVSTPYSPGNTLKTYLSPTPINYPTTEYGVQLINVNAATVGNNTSFRNTFKKLQNGVRMVKSNAHVIRCDFSDLSTSYNNKGIWAVGDYATSPAPTPPYNGYGTKHRFLVGIGASNYCTFKNLKYGIVADSCMTNYIQNNTFTDINGTGIAIYRSNFYRGWLQSPTIMNFADRDTSVVITNTFTPNPAAANVMQNGIGMFDNAYLFAYDVSNKITLKPAPSVLSEGVGVYHAATNYFSSYYTATNLITGTGNYGVHEVNNAGYTAYGANTRGIISNTITVANGSGFPNLSLSAGIYSQNSPYATIKENIIDETGIGTPLLLFGILIDNGQQDYIGCNLIKNTSNSCQVNLNNVGSTFRGNVMDGAGTGLYLYNGTMGNLGSSTSDAGQNEWINNTFSTYVNNGAGSIIYYDNSISARIPSSNAVVVGLPFSPMLSTLGTLGCTQYHKGGNGSYINQKDDNDGLISSIIQNNVSFPNYNQGLLWEHKNGILNLLKDSLLDNTKPLFAQFKQQNNSSKTGKINTLMRSLGNYADVAQNKISYLQNLNNIGVATNAVEQNYKTFMAEYITNVVGVSNTSANSISVMKQLAQKCPYSDGAVVYNARALLKVWGDNELYLNTCEIPTLPDEKVAREMITPMQDNTLTQNVLVYPNPTNGTFNIAYTFEQSGNEFILIDLMGRVVKNTPLENSEGVKELNNSDLNNGVYFYKVTDIKGNMLFTGKIIINK